MKIRLFFLVLLTALFAATGWSATISAQTKANIAAQIKAAGNDPVKLSAAAKVIIAALPASQRAAAGAIIMQALTPEAAKNVAAVNAVVAAAVGEGKAQAARAGAGNAGQTAAATAIANAMLANADPVVFSSAKTTAVGSGAFEASLPQAAGNPLGNNDQGIQVQNNNQGGTGSFTTGQQTGDATPNS